MIRFHSPDVHHIDTCKNDLKQAYVFFQFQPFVVGLSNSCLLKGLHTYIHACTRAYIHTRIHTKQQWKPSLCG